MKCCQRYTMQRASKTQANFLQPSLYLSSSRNVGGLWGIECCVSLQTSIVLIPARIFLQIRSVNQPSRWGKCFSWLQENPQSRDLDFFVISHKWWVPYLSMFVECLGATFQNLWVPCRGPANVFSTSKVRVYDMISWSWREACNIITSSNILWESSLLVSCTPPCS